MRRWSNAVWLLTASLPAFASGPVEFGLSELDAAIAARNFRVKPRIVTEINLEAPETFRIEPFQAGGGRIAGGDLRGLMYGLLEAAEQIRATGRLKLTRGAPSLAPRGVKIVADPTARWFGSEDYWRGLMESLARARFDRLHLLFERLPGKDLLPVLRMISQLAVQYSVDLTLGMKSAPEDFGPVMQEILAECAAIRSVSLDSSADELKAPVLAVLRKAGRRVVLDDNRLWQLDPDQTSTRAVMDTLTAGFEVALPPGGLIGAWGRLGYKP